MAWGIPLAWWIGSPGGGARHASAPSCQAAWPESSAWTFLGRLNTIRPMIPPPDRLSSAKRRSAVIEAIGRILFASRWLVAPLYLGLIGGLILLLIRFAIEAIELLTHALATDTDHMIVGILVLVDLSLVANLLVMVIFAGYENFVSRLHGGDDDGSRPGWIDHIGFGDLKLKLMTSMAAISGIHVLENFMDISSLSNRDLAWAVGLHLTFVTSGLLLAVMDRLSGSDRS